MSKKRFNLLKSMPYKVLHTLIKNKCLASYLNQHSTYNCSTYLCYEHWITRAFVWEISQEGCIFWDNICKDLQS